MIRVHYLPSLTTPETLAGGTAIVIDALRATTVIVHALAAGAKEVVPCLEIDEARKLAAALPSGSAVLGGERRGVKIDGFDLGNSPEEYSPEKVQGKTVVLTTTNGTRALNLCRQAKRVLIGAAVNVSAVAKTLHGEENVHILCAGTDGQITQEDVLVAGLIAARLNGERSDEANLACLAAVAVEEQGAARLRAEFTESRGGQNLVRLGFQKDIAAAAQIDRFSLVPELNLATWCIQVR